MTNRTIEPEQHRAAKVVGFFYLFTMATAIFGEMYVRGQLIVPGDAVQSAANIAASERLFRLGVVSDLITSIGVVILVWALYIVLKPINKNLALLATFLRFVEISIAAASIVNSIVALRLLSNAAYLQAFDTQQLQVLARLSISEYGFGLQIVFVFLGLGSTVFSYLWFKSRYIPRALSAFGIFGSLMLTTGGLAIMVFPSLEHTLELSYMMPLGIFEITLGPWLLFKGVRVPVLASTSTTPSANNGVVINRMLKSVHPVLGASDVNISCRFYESLGFATVFRDDPAEPKYAAVVRDGVEIHLQWASKEQFANSMDRPTYRFLVRDVDALYAELQSIGAITEETTGLGPWRTPDDTPWGTREFHLHDPDRNGLHFYRAL